MEMSREQQDIISANGNLVISAGAGSGKTRVLVEKMQRDLDANTSWKTVAGITFTIKASKEIRNRLILQDDNIFIGTNNAFCISEIIKPFARDVYDGINGTDFDTAYTVKQNTFDDCLRYLKEEKKLCVLQDNRQNFIFKLALYILRNSQIARDYLSSKYCKLYIDEYQDTDTDMHNLFLYLLDELHIELFIVGDEKQSIYRWRGANPKLFINLFNDNRFAHKELNANFRSTPQIQNLSNIICETRLDLIGNIAKNITDSNIIQIASNDMNNFIVETVNNLSLQTCVLCRTNRQATDITNFLNSQNLHFICIPATPMDDISNNSAWVYASFCEYYYLDKNIYKFIDQIPNIEEIENKRNNFYVSIKNKLTAIEDAKTNETEFISKFKLLGAFIDCELTDEAIKLTRDTILDIENKGYKLAFIDGDKDNQVATIHKSKGKEFDLVFLFAEDYNSWQVEDKNLFYVATTRAKKKAYILTSNTNNSNAIKYIKNAISTNHLDWHNFFAFENRILST
jgi:ATP-dependent exoDNAse (exonuclease V) beta subunit